ncbi:MAG: amidohydrolase family protein [bacterium]|nr:amidohydrolase family protein [bacterium]MDE0290335.1 amidohydrolase family protein [bacterium]MDE0440264.1 amidohydrolase family protein [bacterium]
MGEALALQVATLIDGTGRPPVRNATVLVSDGRVIAAGPHIDIPASYELVRLPKSTLVPGLIDAHTHIEVTLSGKEFGAESAAIFDWHTEELLAHGVTGVRDTGGTGFGFSYSRLQAEDRPEWPRFVGSGPNLDGPPGAPYPGLRVVTDPRAAATAAAELISKGAPFLKTYVWLPQEDLQAVVSVAHRSGVPVAAHVGNAISVGEAVAAGVDALEHICSGRELLDAESRVLESGLPERPHDWVLSLRPWRFVDLGSDRVRRHVEALAESRVTITPTLAILRVFCRPDEAYAMLEARHDLPRGLGEAWRATWPGTGYSEDDVAHGEHEWEAVLQFVEMLHTAGVVLVAGSDIPNPGTYPGASLHHEIGWLADCGLGMVGAVHAATGAAAALMGRSDIGVVRGGMRADLVVLDGDLTADATALAKIEAVLRDGQVVHGSLGDTTAEPLAG